MKGNSETGSPFSIADNTADLMQVTQPAPPSRASYRVGEWLQRFIAKCTGSMLRRRKVSATPPGARPFRRPEVVT